jgi:hypothetical protein
MSASTPVAGRVAVPRASRAGALLGAALVALIALAHTRAARPVLRWAARALGPAASCPLGYDRAATPEQKEAARARFARAHGGSTTPAARPALGFDLGRARRADVLAWASHGGLSCKAGRGMFDIACDDVPDSDLPEADRGAGAQALWFVFGADERLITVTAVAHSDRPEPIGAAFRSVSSRLTRDAGPPAATAGDPAPAALASGPLYQASVEYRFRGYYAVARATNVGAGYALTQEYRALPD